MLDDLDEPGVAEDAVRCDDVVTIIGGPLWIPPVISARCTRAAGHTGRHVLQYELLEEEFEDKETTDE